MGSMILLYTYTTTLHCSDILPVGDSVRANGLLQSIILSGHVIFRQRVSLAVLLCDNDSYFHLFNWCIKRLRIIFNFVIIVFRISSDHAEELELV